MRDEDLGYVLDTIHERMMDRYGKDPGTTEQIIFDTIYEEQRRLEKAEGKSAEAQAAYYDRLRNEAARAGPDRQLEILSEMIQRFSTEVAGHFDPRIYAMATKLGPTIFSALLNSLSPIRLLRSLPEGLQSLGDQIVVQGETEAAKKMEELGTTILVSTHQSNLDSIVLGFALYQLGLPPYTYGAGLNLFHNKMLGFFMHNLGAYKVDRRKTATLYKDILKTYAGCTMELGYNNMFFPGGTRSRSGAVEEKLKMGLLGMGLDAYVHNLVNKKENPDIFVIPCTINYQLILEASTLIDDYLKEVGKSRYIIEDDEFSKPRVVLDFVRQLFALDSRIQVTFCTPLDVFGNRVDMKGRSRDSRGRIIDRKRYVYRNNRPVFDRQRDHEYTYELAGSIVESFHRDTVINATNLVSYTMFQWLLEENPDMGLYRLLRTGGAKPSLPEPEMYKRFDRSFKSVRRLQKKNRLRLGPGLKLKDPILMMSQALAHLRSFHRKPALVRRGDRMFHIDRNLLLYYQNRVKGFGLPERERER